MLRPKTSGNRGLHIYVRVEPRWGHKDVRRAALAFAREVQRRAPDLVTTAYWRSERPTAVFIDFNQNARDRTIRAAYSVRGTPEAQVSAPITWDELADVDPRAFTMDTMPARFASLGDVHAGIDDAVYSLDHLLEWAERDEHDHGLDDPGDPS